MKNLILAIFAHPDDEVLACGATLAKLADEGNLVKLLILSKGCSSRESYDEKKRISACKKSCINLGIDLIKIGDFPDNQFDKNTLLTYCKFLEKHALVLNPDIVFTHGNNDLNIDHKITEQAVKIAFRPNKTKENFQMLSCEINSSSEWNLGNEFEPNYFLNIEKYIKKKIDSMKIYDDELCKWPHPRSLEGIMIRAQQRGMQSGFKLAEGFKIILKKNV